MDPVILFLCWVILVESVGIWRLLPEVEEHKALPPYTYTYNASLEDPSRRVSRVALERAVNPTRRLEIVKNDQERTEALRASMAEVGILTPLILVVDRQGKCVLKDGNHRMVAAEALGMCRVPVRVVVSDRIPGWGTNIAPLLNDLLV